VGFSCVGGHSVRVSARRRWGGGGQVEDLGVGFRV